MTMTVCNLNNTLALIGLCLCFALLINAKVRKNCPGPRHYYDEIGCTPVFKTPKAKCPERYNCDHLKNGPGDKCFLNGHSYEIGEMPRDGDKSPCDVSCICTKNSIGMPTFNCAKVICPRPRIACYMKRNATNCCPGPQVCPKEGTTLPTCRVNGKTYKDGERFKLARQSGKLCYCGEGYTDENIERFCIDSRPPICGIMLRYAPDFRENCVPVYVNRKALKTDCSFQWRYQNDRDAVIASGVAKSTTDEPADPDMLCKFGNLTMRVGEELKQATYYNSVCLKCLCEIPPVPSCYSIYREGCDISNHPNFDDL